MRLRIHLRKSILNSLLAEPKTKSYILSHFYDQILWLCPRRSPDKLLFCLKRNIKIMEKLKLISSLVENDREMFLITEKGEKTLTSLQEESEIKKNKT